MEKTKRIHLSIAILSSLIAIGIHYYLTQKYFGLKFGSVSDVSACNINQILNCDAVSASHYSSLFNIPIATWGFITNIVFLLFALITRFKMTDYPEQTSRYTAWLASFIAFVSLVMGTISLTMIKSICLFCFFCYGLSFISAYCAVRACDGSIIKNIKNDLQHLFNHQKWVGVLVILIPGFVFFLNAVTLQTYGLDKIDVLAQEKISQWQIAPKHTFDNNTGLIFQASNAQDAKMTIVEFADFRCPHCKHAYPTLHAYTQAHPEVKLIFKFFPLDGSCNPDPAMKGGGDGISCHMAFLTQCAETIAHKGWDAHHYFFDNQEKMRELNQNEKISEQFCSDLKLDCTQIKTCTSNIETINSVKANAAEGIQAQITGTPSIFVNGQLLSGGQIIPILEEARKLIESK